MKLSLKLQDDYKQQTQNPPLLKAKLPISIFNQPFTSSLTTATTATPKHLSFSLSTNFSSGPSFRFTYTPVSSNTTAASAAPFSVSLKSGLGLFGSPHDSPLIFSAHFSLSSTNPSTISPTFLLHFKPQFGHFSLHKTTSSANPNPRNLGSRSGSAANLQSGSPPNYHFASGSVVNEALGWQDVKLEPCSTSENGFGNGVGSGDGIGFVKERVLEMKDGEGGGLFGGISVKAKTLLPVTKGLKVNLRWGVNLPANSEVRMPYLTVNKIGIERVEKVEEVKKMNSESNVGDLELLKGMCFWMSRDLELLEKENRDMKQCLEDMRMGVSARSYRGVSDSIGKKVFPSSSEGFSEARGFNGFSDSTGKKVFPSSSESFGELERRSRKNGEGNGKTEAKKSVSQASDLESELQKAIMAAASS
ncbi:hypothetical protein Pint_03379 [Pistacia integerrima]|uniref:Uncharacterized protein n=1 Tax=Pistacia integerrima TaxID=434235 RepID=A0ACC0ZHG6_9ROSI|nr:hypothetical protein Pint_03379 [Pistacia integerrima]